MENSAPGVILQILNELYPNPQPELNFETPFQLLVAAILSAQTTDKQVNAITAGLFRKYSTPREFALLTDEELEKEIKSCGLYKNKARNIIAASKILLEKYDSRVPDEFAALISLPGVGRKTANVVLANAFGKDAIAVDTHVFRVANRLGLAAADTTAKTEDDLMNVIPKSDWNRAHHWLIFHGRRVCRAQKPKCHECLLKDYCKYYARQEKKGF
ncbi:endonuclease III [Phosphitispora sp. TUW77]|uniref:endonuclease III n=1 Tax=Phosphitispora sp. TUW77 TaxID=3152361 RepID=UPI003AB34D46